MSSKTSMQKHPILSTVAGGIPGYLASRPDGQKNSFDPAAIPKQQGSANFYGDQLVSQTYQDPTYGTVTKYMPTQAEQQARTSAQNQLAGLIPQLGQSSADEMKQYDNMANAYADNETQAFNREYDPALRNLREDYASRFGGGQNTAYIDALGNMENQVRTPALLNIANNAAQKKQDLYNQAQTQKLNELQGLGYALNGNQQNFLNNIVNPQQVTNANNNFNQQNYGSQLQNFQYNQGLQQQQNQAFLNAIAAIGGAAAKSAF